MNDYGELNLTDVDDTVKEEITLLITGLGYDGDEDALINTEVIYRELEFTHSLPYDHIAVQAFENKGKRTIEEIYDIAINQAKFDFLKEHRDEHLEKIKLYKKQRDEAIMNAESFAKDLEAKEKAAALGSGQGELDANSASQTNANKAENSIEGYRAPFEPHREAVKFTALTLAGWGVNGAKYSASLHGKLNLRSNVKKAEQLNNFISSSLLDSADNTINPKTLKSLSKKANKATKSLGKAYERINAKAHLASESIMDRINKAREETESVLERLKKSKLAELHKELKKTIESVVESIKSLVKAISAFFTRNSPSFEPGQ